MLARVYYHFGRPPKLFWYILFMLLLVAFFSSCKTTEYIEVPKIQKEVEYRDKIERDTTYVHDSIYVHQKNDTIYIDKYKYIYREKLKVDTCNIFKTETITKVITREKEFSKWQKLQMGVGGATLTILLFILVAFIIYIVAKIYNRIR